ncbi:hypothetical protein M9Y10_033884 [Tritrichomonas musculus]|uniref:Protein kinase domain-containing protein n=1 Tax=Tritrichomonas musculus TaxID=1915356 RepID=A0ABR2KDC7_9EUKA
MKINKNRIFQLNSKLINKQKELFDEKDYIELRDIGNGGSFKVTLIYHIEKEELFVTKFPLMNDEIEADKLINRQIKNNELINHPFLPKFYGKVQNQRKVVFEFIKGNSLSNIHNIKLTKNDKLSILFKLMISIQYLHENNLVFRDLKPENIILDDNKLPILIDFDRMVNMNFISDEQNFTSDFSNVFMAPEVNKGEYSYECDIYSIGMLIKYMMNDFVDDDKLKKMYIKCTNEDPKERPSILNLILIFFLSYHIEILKTDQYNQLSEYFISLIQSSSDKIIEQIDNDNICILADLFENNSKFPFDINKTIHYYTIAANKKCILAQFKLAYIYYENQDLKNAIYYYTLSAEQGHVKSQYILGIIYLDKKSIFYDVQKGIHYCSKAANQNYIDALYKLGLLYYKGEEVPLNYDLAISYLKQVIN